MVTSIKWENISQLLLKRLHSVQKNVYLPLTVTMRLTNIPGKVSVFVRMYIQCNVMQFNTLFIIFTLDIKQCPIYSLENSLAEAFSNNFLKFINN